jgi:DNA-binding LytR/AlgR family response regulator
MSLRVLVADDEELPRRRLCRFLRSTEVHAGATSIDEAEDGAQACALLLQNTYDVVFLDIEMPGLSGFQVIEEYRRATALKGPQVEPAFVYQTAFADFGPQAFDQDATDYLLKPVSQERVARSLERALRRRSSIVYPDGGVSSNPSAVRSQLMTSTYNGLTRVFALDDVQRFCLMDGQVMVRLVDGSEVPMDKSLAELESELPQSRFLRIHRSCLVAIPAVCALIQRKGHLVELVDGTRWPVARRRVAAIRSALLQRL